MRLFTRPCFQRHHWNNMLFYYHNKVIKMQDLLVAIEWWIPLQHMCIAKYVRTYLLASHLRYAYGENNKSTVCYIMHAYFIAMSQIREGRFEEIHIYWPLKILYWTTAFISDLEHCIGYCDTVNSDYFSQRSNSHAKILAKGMHFPMLLKCKFCLHECNKLIYHWLIAYPIHVPRKWCK